VHFIEKVVERLLDIVVLGAFAGVFWYACGGEISRYTLFGVTYMVLILNALAANLRHSHVWLSFGPVIEHVLNSPAQHQIHHSDAVRHHDKNFGVNLSVWDWMFGTLYLTQSRPEAIRFGTGEEDHDRYLTVGSLIVTPFVETVRKLHTAIRLNQLHALHLWRGSLLPLGREAAPQVSENKGPAAQSNGSELPRYTLIRVNAREAASVRASVRIRPRAIAPAAGTGAGPAN
jgi:hypothetical protein